jgi:radical SAM protein with 4Fe4S-binding SPASM domain
MCPNKHLEPHQLGMMDFDLFKKVIDEAKDFIHDANIHHRGESLLHKELIEMINYAGKNNVLLKLHTNATLLNEKKAKEIMETGLDLISFSFEGLDKATYEKYRVGANYEKTMNNILRFLEIKKKLKKSKPFTVLELIDFSDSDKTYDISRLTNLKKKLEGLPLNRIIVKKPHNFAGNINSDKTINNRSYSPCTFLWHSILILWNGDVSPCPQDFHGKIILGNVMNDSLREIFNGNKIIALREKALKGDVEDLEPCFQCDITTRKRFLGLPVNSLRHLER